MKRSSSSGDMDGPRAHRLEPAGLSGDVGDTRSEAAIPARR